MAFSIGEVIGAWIRIAKNPAEGIREVAKKVPTLRESLLSLIIPAVVLTIITFLVSPLLVGSAASYYNKSESDVVVFYNNILLIPFFMLLIFAISAVVYIGLSMALGGKKDNLAFLIVFGITFGAYLAIHAIVILIVGLLVLLNFIIGIYAGLILGIIVLAYFVLIFATLIHRIFRLEMLQSITVSAIPFIALIIIGMFFSFGVVGGFSSLLVSGTFYEVQGLEENNENIAIEPCPADTTKEISGITVTLQGWETYNEKEYCHGVASGGSLEDYGSVEFYFDPENLSDMIIIVNGTVYGGS